VALLWRTLLGSLRDLTPVVAVVFVFHVAVLRQPATDLLAFLEGAVLVVIGLTLLMYGLQLALLPIGEALANALAERGSFAWLLVFAFLLGFGTPFAEPALTAVAAEAATAAASAGAIADSDAAKRGYALGLRFTVALAVGVALMVGAARIVLGWSLTKIVIGGYVIVLVLSLFAPADAIGIAYDSGGVTTSVITVPLVTALGIGLASSLLGRNPLTDGFGMIILIILTPMIFIMGFATVMAWL
jgi:hypothetical protein